MASIRLQGLEKTYGENVRAVRGLNLDIADGELVVLLGPSGCGKSTVLRLVAGLEAPTSGSVHIGGRRVDDQPPHRRDVAMVFQSYALYGHMTVAENIAFPLRMRGVPGNERRRRVREMATLLELDALLDARPGALSGGQQQRVAMGRALVRHPAAFLLDEPLSNLDARLRTQVREEIRRIQRDLGVTTIHVTHDQVEALSLGDRVAVLRAGAIEQCAPGQELYDRPATAFVAAFLGQPGMNLIRAGVGSDGGEVRIAAAPASVRVDQELAATLRGLADGEVLLGVRPEDVELGGNEDPGLPGTVKAVEDLGSERVVHVETPAPTLDPVAANRLDGSTVVARLRHGTGSVKKGDGVTLRFPSHAIRLFDSKGRAIDTP